MSVLRDTLAIVEPDTDVRGDNVTFDDGAADDDDDDTEPMEAESLQDPIQNDADAWNWVNTEVYHDPRSIVGPHMPHFSKDWFKNPALESATPGQLFAAFLPCVYIEKR